MLDNHFYEGFYFVMNGEMLSYKYTFYSSFNPDNDPMTALAAQEFRTHLWEVFGDLFEPYAPHKAADFGLLPRYDLDKISSL